MRGRVLRVRMSFLTMLLAVSGACLSFIVVSFPASAHAHAIEGAQYRSEGTQAMMAHASQTGSESHTPTICPAPHHPAIAVRDAQHDVVLPDVRMMRCDDLPLVRVVAVYPRTHARDPSLRTLVGTVVHIE